MQASVVSMVLLVSCHAAVDLPPMLPTYCMYCRLAGGVVDVGEGAVTGGRGGDAVAGGNGRWVSGGYCVRPHQFRDRFDLVDLMDDCVVAAVEDSMDGWCGKTMIAGAAAVINGRIKAIGLGHKNQAIVMVASSSATEEMSPLSLAVVVDTVLRPHRILEGLFVADVMKGTDWPMESTINGSAGDKNDGGCVLSGRQKRHCR
ncbi:hypothetical protein ACLOJK_028531 [Asimina triloba]